MLQLADLCRQANKVRQQLMSVFSLYALRVELEAEHGTRLVLNGHNLSVRCVCIGNQ